MTLISTRQIKISLIVSNKLHSSVTILCEAVKDLSDSCEAGQRIKYNISMSLLDLGAAIEIILRDNYFHL